MKKLFASVLALVLALSLMGAAVAESVNVTYVTSPLNVPSIIEREKGIFQKHFDAFEATVGYSELTTGPEQTQALASGDIQFLYCVGATSVILAASNEADIKIISMYSRSPKAFRLFSEDASISSPEDLRGKTVVGPMGTILHELLVAYLATADMTIDDVNFVNMGIPDAVAALSGGSADAALAAGPAAYNLTQAGKNVVTTGEGLVDATIVVATTNEYIENNPEKVDAFLAAQAEILTYIEENHDEAISIVATALDLAPEAVEEMYTYYDFSMEITENDILSMEKTEQFMLDTEMIENPVEIRDLIYTKE